MKKLFFFTIIAIGMYVIGNFIVSTYQFLHKKDLLTQAQQELKKEKLHNYELKKELGLVKSSGFIEEQARDKLFFSKPGENMIIIPSTLAREINTTKQMGKPQVTYWQQWFRLFFY